MIGADVQNTTRPDLKGGAAKGKEPATPLAPDFRRLAIKQIIVNRMKGQR